MPPSVLPQLVIRAWGRRSSKARAERSARHLNNPAPFNSLPDEQHRLHACTA